MRKKINTIDPSHKSHNALVWYPAMHHLVTEMCTDVHIAGTKWCIVGYGTGASWYLWIRPIPMTQDVICNAFSRWLMYFLRDLRHLITHRKSDFLLAAMILDKQKFNTLRLRPNGRHFVDIIFKLFPSAKFFYFYYNFNKCFPVSQLFFPSSEQPNNVY